MDGWEQALSLLPVGLRRAAGAVPEGAAQAEEIRLRAGERPTLLLPGGERPFAEAPVTCAQLAAVLEIATRASLHAAMPALCRGYVAVRGGVRLGVCGTAAMEGERVAALRNCSSLALRIPRPMPEPMPACLAALTGAEFASTLICAPPGAGKTTLLRELVRRLSESGQRVALADERGEVAAVWEGTPGFAVGRCTDVLTGVPKAQAVLMLLRGMNPRIIALDEITDPADARACLQAAGCGVKLLATVHAEGAEVLSRRPMLRELLAAGVFARAVCIENRGGVRTYREEALPCT